MEEWKDIKGYEGLYQVSNLGRVKSLGNGKSNRSKCIIMKTAINHKGYAMIRLCKDGVGKGFSVHRLVAESFLANHEHKPQVNHLNGLTWDNRVTNLEWATCSENNLHAYRELNRKAPRSGLGKLGSKNPASRAVLQIKRGETIACFGSMLEADRATGINFRNISSCCKGIRKSAGGFQWKYKEQGGL